MRSHRIEGKVELTLATLGARSDPLPDELVADTVDVPLELSV
jgi:hypothetical protein